MRTVFSKLENAASPGGNRPRSWERALERRAGRMAGPPLEPDQLWITMLPPPSAVEAVPSSAAPIWLS